jgi:hypothetical protein
MFRRLIAFAAAAVLSAGLAHSASVRPLPLDEIIDGAATSFEGTCLENRTERDSNGFIVTYTTFAVKDVLKGVVGDTHTIKQLGGVLQSEGIAYKVDGVPSYAVGQEYVVFLHGVSKIGFSSPVGFGQGSFRVQRDEAGAKVTNGRDFRVMTAGTDALKLPSATAKSLAQSVRPVERMDLDEFKAMVRMHAGTAR